MVIPVQTVPYARLAKRLFLGRGALEAIADHQQVVCPEEIRANRPAIFLPGQLERITGAPSESTKEEEVAAAIAPTTVHGATIAYHIKGATLVDGSIYARHYRHFIADKSLIDTPPRELRHLKTAALASSYYGTKYFGHWLRDDCPSHLLAADFGEPLCLRTPFPHQQAYQDYFGQDWTPTDRARIDHLVIFQDFGHNSLKRKRFALLRNRLRSRYPGTGKEAFVYLRRGRSGVARLVQNEDEILEAIVKLGFVILDVASDPLDRILATLADAKLVVSIEGSHLAHCGAAIPTGGGLLVLQPCDRFSHTQRSWCESVGARFGFVVGMRSGAGYHFSVSEILRTTDLMLRNIETQPDVEPLHPALPVQVPLSAAV